MSITLLTIIKSCAQQGRTPLVMTIPFAWFHQLLSELENHESPTPNSLQFHGVFIHKGLNAMSMEFAP